MAAHQEGDNRRLALATISLVTADLSRNHVSVQTGLVPASAQMIFPLAWHFAKKFTQPVNKRIEFIPPEDREALAHSHWPANLRSVVLSSDAALHHPPLAQMKQIGKSAQLKTRTLAEAEREHILQALRDTEWVIGGPDRPAVQLEVRRTALLCKMWWLGISHPKNDGPMSKD
jgi:transcriptional regulator with GAF, ATPase, and Fis domain